MDPKKLAETKKPKFWIEDYWNEWASRAGYICFAQEGDGIEELKATPVKTFPEYVVEKEYYMQKCDLAIIPGSFIHQSNRLVRLYNALIAQEEIDLNKLERVTLLANKLIYK